MTPASLSAEAIPGIPVVEAGCDLASVIGDATERAGCRPGDGDIFVVAQKIVSKAEDRVVLLDEIEPRPQAIELAAETDKDPRVVELILRESRRVVRSRPGVIITEHRLGMILANAGIDRSNVSGEENSVLLLPADPDASALDLRSKLESRFGASIGVVITDSVGRPWRLGTTGIAIGCAGVPVLEDLRGSRDLFGRIMEVSEVATADAIAATATLLSGEGDEGRPVVLIRGFAGGQTEQNAKDLLRPPAEDLFRD